MYGEAWRCDINFLRSKNTHKIKEPLIGTEASKSQRQLKLKGTNWFWGILQSYDILAKTIT